MKLLERIYNKFIPWYNENEQRERDAGCVAVSHSAHAAIAKAESVVNGYKSNVVYTKHIKR
jgi:ABC-type sulfate transport system substrate-binding protein